MQQHLSQMERLEGRTMLDNTLATAAGLGLLGQASRVQSVSPADTVDVYRFGLAAPGNVTAGLRSVSANAELELIHDRNGNLIIDSGEKLRLSYEGGTTREWVSTGLVTGGNYYLRVLNASGSTATASYTIDVSARSYVTGAYGYAQRSGEQTLVGFERLDGSTAPLDLNAPTWVVAHGRFSGPHADNITRLAAAIDGYQGGDQVLALDWSSAVRRPGTTSSSSGTDFLGEGWIPYVATFVAQKLTGLGFSASNLISLAGHSWGAVLSGEIAARMRAPGTTSVFGVNRIVALDPARDSSLLDPTWWNLSYNTESVNFAANSRFARAFFANASTLVGFVGSATSSATADESFRVNVGGGTAAHSNVVTLFSTMLERNNAGSPDAVSRLFSLGTMSSNVAKPWKLNAYDSSGSLSSTGKFEGVLEGVYSGGNWIPRSLRYVDKATQSEVTVYA